MRDFKYYGTNIMYTPCKDFMDKYGKNHHNQWHVVCKAHSMAEANRIATSFGLSDKTFTSAYTSETGNELQLKMCDQYGFIVNPNGTGYTESYVDIKEMLKSK